MRPRSLVRSFNHAFEGILHVVRTQRNMRLHFLIAIGALALGLVLGFSRIELVILLLLVTLVVVAELLNTAIEAAIDVITTELDPAAKIAKDVAAAAVLVAASASLIIGYLLFFDRLNQFSFDILATIRNTPIHITAIALVLVFLVSVGVKALSGHGGSILRGGLPSIHSGISFAGTAAIFFLTKNAAATTVALLMALLVAQSRIEAGIHTPLEVTVGALLGLLITVLIFQVAG